jgi:hypothetical protein
MVKQPFFVVKTMVKATVSDGEKKGPCASPLSGTSGLELG